MQGHNNSLTVFSLLSSVAYLIPILCIFMTTIIFIATSVSINTYLFYIAGCFGAILVNHVIVSGWMSVRGQILHVKPILRPECHIFNIAPVSSLTLNKIIGSGFTVTIYNFLYSLFGMIENHRVTTGYFIMNLIMTLLYAFYLSSMECSSWTMLLSFGFLTTCFAIPWYLLIVKPNSQNIFSYTDKSNRTKCQKLSGKNAYKCTIIKNGSAVGVL